MFQSQGLVKEKSTVEIFALGSHAVGLVKSLATALFDLFDTVLVFQTYQV